ncbi:MAG: OmpA family protein [Candidatus Krumholzibacteriota bacterium]|nr:OmpA family protein [Candidatus Krumholzibacteriota bacterium]
MKSLVVLLMIAAVIMTPVDLMSSNTSWNGTAGLLRVYGANTIGSGKLVFSLGTSYSRRSDLEFSSDPVDYNFMISRAGVTLGLSRYMEVSAAIDVRNWILQSPDDTWYYGGLGDTRANLKLCLPLPTERIKLGALTSASFPTGEKDRMFSTDAVDYSITGLATLDLTDITDFVPTRVHLNTGYHVNRNENGFGILTTLNPFQEGFYPPAYPATPDGEESSYNDMFRLGTGVEFILKERSRIFAEFVWDEFRNADFGDSLNTSTYTITPGFSLASADGVELLMAIEINLNSEDSPSVKNPPDWFAYAALSFGGFVIPQDADKDGIEDKLDKCPQEAEDVDGFEDEDGCPDLDNDGDGIKDVVDKCPDLAEDFDGFEDEDGCPDLDNDGDGIADVDDRCPNEPEDFDGIQDSDGCPDVIQDTDGDGVPDDSDKCPEKKEDPDGYQDEDGCPDLDNDLDGIPDDKDKCPNAPETFNGYEDEDGCPDERPIKQKFILKGVHFESGSSKLTPDSYSVLDRVVKTLKAYPEVKVEIRGYTDSVGSWEANLKLSEKRANSVKEYLLNSGLASDRLVTEGYGEADPVESNETAEGRASNRRIEFHRLN